MAAQRSTNPRSTNPRSAAQSSPARRLTTQRLLQILALGGALGVVALLVVFILTSPERESADAQVVRENSHILNQASDEKAVLVEFLDFECEACRAFYPSVEQLREERADELTLVMRYFPIPGHTNSTTAAVAVEAAAAQGQLKPMYQRMYETQAEWGEAQESKAPVFRGFAEELGLDMDAFDAAVADPATTERVQSDFQEGQALGVDSTPTFFLDGERLEVQGPEQLVQAVEAALDE